MSEKIYTLLLRLYPSSFREAYGEEALQLFRDRSRDEKGFTTSIRLWCDLMLDLVVTVPRQYRAWHALVAAPVYQHDTAPSFYFLEDESPRFGALLFGGVVSLLFLYAISTGISQVGKYAGGTGIWPETTAPTSGRNDDSLSAPQSNSARQNHAGSIEAKLDSAERRRVIETAVADLKRYYIDSEIAQKVSDSLLAHEKRGDYDSITDGEVFADLLTQQTRNVSHDNHLIVAYSSASIAEQSPALAAERFARYREQMKQDNCTFEKTRILARNVGYLKLNSFPDASVCRSTAEAAMASLNSADAVIFDLRDNSGGFPNMVSLIAAYLFDHPEYMYNPRENTTENSWTRSPVPGSRLADKPAYILTSSRTLSGAEQFTYDMKMLKRATLVGETTGGAAHSGTYHRIDDHFGIGITEVRAINPFSEGDWDGKGVEPDVKVKAADALEAAERLAATRLSAKK